MENIKSKYMNINNSNIPEISYPPSQAQSSSQSENREGSQLGNS